MENENRTPTNADKITENKKVVKGSEIIDMADGGAANVEEIARINRGIGNRITEIREEAGMTQEDFYSLLYPTSNETITTKRKRMGEIENAKAFSDKPTGAKLIDFGRLLFISQRFQVPLDYLLYGKTEQTTEMPPAMQVEKDNTPEENGNTATEPPVEIKADREEIPPITIRNICRFLVAILPLFKVTARTRYAPSNFSDCPLKPKPRLIVLLDPRHSESALNLSAYMVNEVDNKTEHTYIDFWNNSSSLGIDQILNFLRDYLEIQELPCSNEERKKKITALISQQNNDPIPTKEKQSPAFILPLSKLLKYWFNGKYEDEFDILFTTSGIYKLGAYVFSIKRHGFMLNSNMNVEAQYLQKEVEIYEKHFDDLNKTLDECFLIKLVKKLFK